MKLRGSVATLMVFAIGAVTVSLRAEDSLGGAIKKVFATPTPPPRKKRATSKQSSEKKKPSPTPTASASPKRHKKTSPSPTPTPTPSPSASESPSPPPVSSPSATEPEKKKGAPATVPADRILEYEHYSPNFRRIADLSLDLTRRNLGYKYGSADPAAGGMDCSGFVYYVLTQSGIADVPRDSSQQYVWLRKAGSFRAVNSRKDDSFELEELHPGDLLFWTGTYSIERDPPITHAMIYLGREKGSNKRVMVGASDGRTYEGESRYGVSVFEFKISQPSRDKDAKLTPRFIGYAHVPGVSD